MVALDQRESLASMLRAHGADDSGRAMTSFKLDLVRAVAPLASGLLINAGPGYRHIVTDRMLPSSCGLILAADELTQQPDGPVTSTAIDRSVDPRQAADEGAVALKLLVIWRADADPGRLVAMADEFIARCRSAGVLSILEPVAQPVEGAEREFDRNSAILDAASALAPLRPDVYKAQVPSAGQGPLSDLIARCERLDAIVPVPWVVLSNGVRAEDFPRAVEAACRGGASGMLAGRAVWSGVLGAADHAAAVADAADRLRRLIDIVTAHGRDWRQK
jgi:sulfofructosephosphate aldolase